MAKYRKCPECGEKNPPNLLACKFCGSDSLEFEKILDDNDAEGTGELPQQTPDIPPVEGGTSTSSEMVRVCDCGTPNPVQARKCSNCGEDISDIVPTTSSGEKPCENVQSYSLCSLDGEFAYEMMDHIVFIGRECEMKSYLEKKSFVSRKHAELLLEEDKLYVKNHSLTNHTFVNNELVPDGKYIELKDGDELGLGGKMIGENRQNEAAYFLVRIGNCHI